LMLMLLKERKLIAGQVRLCADRVGRRLVGAQSVGLIRLMSLKCFVSL